jgi:hypothetical protein
MSNELLPSLSQAAFGTVDPSFLDIKDERFANDAPRIARYYYALTLRDLGDPQEVAHAVLGPSHAVVSTFEPNDAEREEFPELKGISKVILSNNYDDNIISVQVEYGYAAFVMNGKSPRATSVVFATQARAQEFINAIKTEPQAAAHIFANQEPWVARLDQPTIKL